MTSAERIRLLLTRIRQIQELIGAEPDLDSNNAESELSALYIQLEALGPEPPPGIEEPLERRFYWLLESQPKLKKAYLAALDRSLIEILSTKLRFYEDLSESQPLTEQESDQVRRLEAELLAIRNRLDRAIQVLRRR